MTKCNILHAMPTGKLEAGIGMGPFLEIDINDSLGNLCRELSLLMMSKYEFNKSRGSRILF